METIRITASHDILEQVRAFLHTFKDQQIKVQNESNERQYLQNQLNEIDNGKAIFYSLEEAEQILEATIRKYED